MTPLPPPDERPLRAVGARRATSGVPTTRELIETLRSLGKEAETLVALFDARSIAGERHLLSAWAHLGRSRSRGEPRLRDRGAEYALYVAGDDQLPRALEKVGVSDSVESFVVVAERPRDVDATVTRLRLISDPQAYPRTVDATTLDRLGIGVEERSAVPTTAWEGLVLERVTLVDLSAPAGHSGDRRPGHR